MKNYTKSSITINKIREGAVPILRSAGVTRSAVFGSAARGEMNEKSDIDIVIELDPQKKFSLFDLVRLERRLEDIFGRKVDVMTRRSLYPPLRTYIEKDEIVIM